MKSSLLFHTPNTRIRFVDRLTELGISERDFDFYVDTFVKKYSRYWLKETQPGGGWRQIQTLRGGALVPIPFSKYTIARHLQGLCWIAKPMSLVCDFFVIDIDNHSKRGNSVAAQYSQISKTIGIPLVVRSSDSGGIHLYYFLHKTIPSSEILMKCRDLIFSAGVQRIKGVIEVFPYDIQQLRLPLGAGSVLLNPNTLEPMGFNLKQSLNYIQKFKSTNALNFEGLANRLSSVPPVLPQRPQFSYPASQIPISTSVNEFRIADYGTRNKTMMRLVQDAVLTKGLGEDDAFNYVLGILENKQLGHKSKDLEQRPKMVYAELRSMIKNLEGKKRFVKSERSGQIPFTPLSIGDMAAIERLSSKANLTDRKGDLFPRFLFHLLAFFKGMNSYQASLPFKTVAKLDGCSKRTAKEFIDICVRLELLIPISPADRHLHRSRVLRLNHTFGRGGDVPSYDDGAAKLAEHKKAIAQLRKSGLYGWGGRLDQ